MSRVCAKHFLFFSLFTFVSFAVVAQNSNKENAPYSRYGIGELSNGTNVLLRGMGYTTTAYNSSVSVNTENPASFAFLRFTTYEAGATASTRTISAGGHSYTSGSASLAYLNVGIPLGKNGGLAFGLRPQSRVFYHSVDSLSRDSLGRTASEYTGEGGLNYAYLGAAIKRGGFSLGFNLGYMFGTISNTARLVELDTVHAQNSDFSTFTKIGGLYWKGGAQYQTELNKKLTLNLGVTATISQSLNASADNYNAAFHYSSGTEVQDTAYTTTGHDGKIKLPLSFSAGAGLSGVNWAAYLDFSSTKWDQYRSYDVQDLNLTATSRISAGAEFTPDPIDFRKYTSRITYRIGFYYGNDYVKLRDTKLDVYAATAGVSLPFRRSADRIHLALEAGRHGTESNNLVQENFFKLHLGISLNDKWFIKRKYD